MDHVSRLGVKYVGLGLERAVALLVLALIPEAPEASKGKATSSPWSTTKGMWPASTRTAVSTPAESSWSTTAASICVRAAVPLRRFSGRRLALFVLHSIWGELLVAKWWWRHVFTVRGWWSMVGSMVVRRWTVVGRAMVRVRPMHEGAGEAPWAPALLLCLFFAVRASSGTSKQRMVRTLSFH
jgi:hypothetical protein